MKYAIWGLMYVGLVVRLIALCLMWRRDLISRYVCLSTFLVLSSLRTSILLYLRHTDQDAYAVFHSSTADAIFLIHIAMVLEALYLLGKHYPNVVVMAVGGVSFAGVMATGIVSWTSGKWAAKAPELASTLSLRLYSTGIVIVLVAAWLFYKEFKRPVRANLRWHCLILYVMFSLIAIGSGMIAAKSSLAVTGWGMIALVLGDITAGAGWSICLRRTGEAFTPPAGVRTIEEIEG
jgi:hypothetical protein